VVSKGKKKSLEEKKSGIVKTLLGMNNQMRDFTHDIEARLEGAYKQGASKKFGYDDITQASQKQMIMGGDSMSKYEDRMLGKIQS
jgi:hypothetical protein